MIKYNLKCNNDHEFESLFSDSKEFERLKTRKLLECIYCNSKKIKKSIMAPMISISKNNNLNKFQINEKILQKQRNKLIKLSPNKTYAGVIGSFLSSLLSGLIFIKYIQINYLDEISFKIFFFILLISLISQIGDLTISYFKRKAKCNRH